MIPGGRIAIFGWGSAGGGPPPTGGSIFSWGLGTSGGLGLGNTTSYSSPKQIGALTTWTAAGGGGSPLGKARGRAIGNGNKCNLIIKSDRTLWAFGLNNRGQLGLGNTTAYSSPKQVGSNTNWHSASLDSNGGLYGSVIALLNNGTMYSWGNNASGQLGLGNTTHYSVPKQIGSLNTWSFVSNGSQSVAAITYTGKLYTWGVGTNGVLGLGGNTSYSSPKQVGALTNWKTVAVGQNFMVATKHDGTLWSWGRGLYGCLGLGNTTTYYSPKQVGALTNWDRAFAAQGAGFMSLAIKTDGTLWTWGGNTSGELGLGNITNYSSPKQVGSGTTWTTNVAGSTDYAWHVIKTDGTLWTWGRGTSGTLGLGNTTTYSSPKQVGALTNWANVGGSYQARIGVIAPTYTGTSKGFAWGRNRQYGLGFGNRQMGRYYTPTQLRGDYNWSKIVGGNNSCIHAIKTDGTLWVWGQNSQGMMGNGASTGYVASPTQIGALSNWSIITHAYSSTAAIKTDGTLWTWGLNNYGNLGLGNTTSYSSPKQVGAGTNWSKVAGFYGGFLALTTTGKLYSWGKNSNGVLGQGDLTNRSTPTQIGTATDWTNVASASSLGLNTGAIRNGALFTWGRNNQGQLGLGNITDYSSPKQVGALTTWTSCCFTNYQNSFGILGTGKLYSWGRNGNGELGLGNTTNYSSPKLVGAATNWSEIRSSNNSPIGRRTDGTIWAWGRGTFGTLGQGNQTYYSTPKQIGALTTWTWAMAACQTGGNLAFGVRT